LDVQEREEENESSSNASYRPHVDPLIAKQMYEKILNSVVKITFHSSPMEKFLILDRVFTLITNSAE
jgi:hypothetical protein